MNNFSRKSINKDLILQMIQQGNQGGKISFSELEQFRSAAISSPEKTFHPYTIAKSKTTTYRIFFGVFALLFLFFSYFVYTKSPQPLIRQYFDNIVWVQNSITFLCASLGVASGLFAWFLSPESEAMEVIHSRSRKKLRRIYHHLSAKKGFIARFPVSADYAEWLHLKESFDQTKDAFEKLKEELIHLLHRIQQASKIHPESRETLYNQALVEFSLKLDRIIQKFEGKATALIC